MTEILTELIGSPDYPLDAHETHQVYNGLDTCLTLEIWNELQPIRESMLASASVEVQYNFTRALQGPALEMMLRGIRVDQYWRWKSVAKLEKDAEFVKTVLDEFASAVWGKPLNPNSPKQLKDFFYGAMKLPEQHRYDKGQRKVSTDREALEKLKVYYHPEPIINCILKLRDLLKKISVLRTEVDADSRMRTSYNIAGTETSRWSSSSNARGGGTNLQNITEELRRVFIADPGKKLANIDFAQGESFAVGWLCWMLFAKHSYLDACQSGDLHTSVCRLIWPNLGWSGDRRADKELAEQNFYRHFSHRDMAKRGGHGTNYYGQPPTMAKHLNVTTKLIEEFQRNYFSAFPEIPNYHRYVAKTLQLDGTIPTPLGTARTFFGRLNDDATLREAIAYVPQHMVGVLLNLALWRVWYHLGREVDILAQVHDSILIQFPEEKEEEILPKVIKLMGTKLTHEGRSMTIPSDCAVGWNWSKEYNREMAAKDEQRGKKPKPLNLDGLRNLDPGQRDPRSRSEAPEANGLDRIIS